MISLYPVLWNDGSYNGWCPWCGERIRQGDDCSVSGDETICGSCAQEARKELADELDNANG